jgi:hypothetical protein
MAMTQPRCVVRKSGLTEDLYLDAQGEWAEYKDAKRFRTDTAAEAFADQHGLTGYGIFPCSTSRHILS